MQWKIILICAAGWGADMPMSGFYEVFLPGLRPPASGLSRTLRRTLRPSALRSDIRLLISFSVLGDPETLTRPRAPLQCAAPPAGVAHLRYVLVDIRGVNVAPTVA